jgi:hypothetical protein
MHKQDSQITRSIFGSSLIAFPLLGLTAGLLDLVGVSGIVSAFVTILAVAVMIIAAVGISVWLYQPSPRLAAIAGLVAVMGTAAGGLGWIFLDLFTAVAANAGLSAAFTEAVDGSTSVIIWLSAFGLLSPVGFILLAVGAQRTGKQPTWVTAVQIIGMMLFVLSWFAPSFVVLLFNATVLVGYSWLGRQFFNSVSEITPAVSSGY